MRRGCSIGVGRQDVLDSGCHVADPAQAEQGRGYGEPPRAYVEGGTCRLVSRNRNAFKTFEPLAQAISQELSGRSAILDGEIVRPGPDGRPMFYAI